MSELRDDLVTGRLVLLAPGRAARPHTVEATPAPTRQVEGCPFCPGNERATPPERGRTGPGAPDTPGWRVRVVPNLYPIVGAGEPTPSSVDGAHEVVILDPDHSCDLGHMTDHGVAELFAVLLDRARVHIAAGSAHAQVLVNHGRAAGASISHPHAQVIALGFVPPAVRDVIARFTEAASDLLRDDFDASSRLGGHVVERDDVWVWCPAAAASPYETRVAAPRAGAHFEESTDDAVHAVARATRAVVAGLETILGDVAYNVVVHNAPARRPQAEPGRDGRARAAEFHWYVSIVPRISIVAGFEMGTGVLVNTMDPATAAANLRDVMPGTPTR
jgi:UDPglucose--hexose-1-phosphate uridylyltransferase